MEHKKFTMDELETIYQLLITGSRENGWMKDEYLRIAAKVSDEKRIIWCENH